MSAKDVIMPIQRWLLSEGRCSGCGRHLEGSEKRKLSGRFVITCSCSHSFEYYEGGFEKAYLTVGD